MNRKAISEPSHSLDRERGILGAVESKRAAQDNEIDWNRLLLAKRALSDHEVADVDVEAPRNSLESSPGTRTPRFSGVRLDDIPYAVEVPKAGILPQCGGRAAELYFNRAGELCKRRVSSNPTAGEVLPIKTLIAQDSSDAEQERKRRSTPGVVARLMGLDALPDKLSRGSPAKPPKPCRSANGFRKETKSHFLKAESSSRPPSPLHDVDTIKDFPMPKSRPQNVSDACDGKSKFDTLPFRAHPQERQLQEFKKEFMDRLASSQRPSPTTSVVPSAAFGDTVNPAGNTQTKLREKLSEAKMALASGGDESRRLSSAQEKLMESKEFLDAIELLQTNKEFFKKFFPGYSSDSLQFACGNKDPPEPESISRRSFHLEYLGQEPLRCEDAPRRSFHLGDLSRDFRKSCFVNDASTKESSRRSFHFGDGPKELRTSSSLYHTHQSPNDSSGGRSHLVEDQSIQEPNRTHPPCVDDVAKDIRPVEDYTQHKHNDHQADTRGHLPDQQHPLDRKKWRESKCRSPGSTPVTDDLKGFSLFGSKPIQMDKAAGSRASPPASPEGSLNVFDDGHAAFDSKKGCESPSRIVVLKPGPGEITLLTPATDPNYSPHSYRVAKDAVAGTLESRDVVVLDSRDRCSPSRLDELSRYGREENRDPRVDPRAIARDIVREARTNSTRELSRDRETGRESPRHPNSVPKNGGSPCGKRVSMPKYGFGVLESTEDAIPTRSDTLGSFTLAALSKRHAMEEKSRSFSSTVPAPNPRFRFKGAATNRDRDSNLDEQLHRTGKAVVVTRVDQAEDQHREVLTDTRRTAVRGHELNRAPMIIRPETYVPGVKSPSRGRYESFVRAVFSDDERRLDAINTVAPSFASCQTLVSGGHKILGIQRGTVVAGSGKFRQSLGEENSNQDVSPQMAVRGKCSPNTGAILVSKTRSSSEAFITKRRHGSNCSNGNGFAGAGSDGMECSEHLFLKGKAPEARQAFLFSRKKVTVGSDLSPREISSRLEENHPRAAEQFASFVPTGQDVRINTSVCSEMSSLSQNMSFLRSSFENAVPIFGPGSVGRTCDYDLREILLQQRVQDHLKLESNLHVDRHRQDTTQNIEVVMANRNGTGSRERCLAMEASEHGDADGTSETSVDKCGQPSPVSVLDAPFEAVEVMSSLKFNGFTQDVQDSRLGPPLLKMNCSDSSTILLESLQVKDRLLKVQNPVLPAENCWASTECSSSRSTVNGASFVVCRELQSYGTPCSQRRLQFLDDIDIEGLPCPEGRQEELIYVRNILEASGLIEGGAEAMARWYSPTCPLDPDLFEKLEDSYVEAELQVALKHGNVMRNSNACMPTGQESFYRRLLFDVVNEVLLHLLGPYVNNDSYVQRHFTMPMRLIPMNHRLISATWLQVCTNFLPRGLEDFETLDCLTCRDVSKSAPWLNSEAVTDQIGIELERTIFESLIEDTIRSIALPQNIYTMNTEVSVNTLARNFVGLHGHM